MSALPADVTVFLVGRSNGISSDPPLRRYGSIPSLASLCRRPAFLLIATQCQRSILIDCVVVCTDIRSSVIFHVFLFSSLFLFFLFDNAVLQLHTDVFTFYSIVAMLLCVVLFAP